LYTIQKITSALQILAYGGVGDAKNEYLWIVESTLLESLNNFTNAVINLYGSEYLRSPNKTDIN
jgi:hypothetical protein